MLPKTYRLSVQHDFGSNATVTVKGSRWKYDKSTGDLVYSDSTWINAATVPDATPEHSADQDNATNEDAGLHGLLIVSGVSITGTCNLYLVTKDGTDYSDVLDSEPLISVNFNGGNGPKKASFEK